MCVSVHRSPVPDATELWDPKRSVITIPSWLDDAHAAVAVRAILNELDVPQPHIGALCWCGDPVLTAPRVPEQRDHDEVMARGA